MDDSEEDYSGISKWKKDKRKFEIKRTIQLQNDEIIRLKNEYKILLKHLSYSNEHFKQVKSIYKSKIQAKRQEISSVQTTTNIIKARMNSSHTKALNAIRANHNKRLQSIRNYYADELGLNQFEEEEEDNNQKEVISSIGSTRMKIADLLNQKYPSSEEQQIKMQGENQEKLKKIMIQVDQDRERCNYLQNKIDEFNSDLQEAKKISSLQQTDIMGSPLKFNASKLEQTMLDKQADLVKEENDYKQNSESQLQRYRVELYNMNQKSGRYKQKIKEINAEAPPELVNALDELKQLEYQHKSIMAQKESLINLNMSIKKSKKRKNETAQNINFCITDLNEVQKENMALKEELRRLDFMIYGRNGKYQKWKFQQPENSPQSPKTVNGEI